MVLTTAVNHEKGLFNSHAVRGYARWQIIMGAARNRSIHIEAVSRASHWSFRTNCLRGDGGRDARDPRIFLVPAAKVVYHNGKEWERNNFPIGITIEYFPTGKAGGDLTDGAPESIHQPAQRLLSIYQASVPKYRIIPAQVEQTDKNR